RNWTVRVDRALEVVDIGLSVLLCAGRRSWLDQDIEPDQPRSTQIDRSTHIPANVVQKIHQTAASNRQMAGANCHDKYGYWPRQPERPVKCHVYLEILSERERGSGTERVRAPPASEYLCT